MPITPERLDSRIYVSRWQGDVTADDFKQAHQQGVEEARAHDEHDFYVLLLDMADDVTLPLNPKGALYVLETVKYDIEAVIIGVNTPPAMQAILPGLDAASPQVSRTETVDTMREGVSLARQIVRERES
jgi:hypothetical protein